MDDNGFEFRSVTKRFGNQIAVLDLSFRLPPGRHTAILGPSGCGKTTALRLLAGLETPTSGEVLLNDKVISDSRGEYLSPHRRKLTLVFQDLALWPNLTAFGNVRLGLSGSRLSRRESKFEARAALELCGVADVAERRPSALSGGQQQRVALARAIAPRPDFMFLDEPFASLDLVVKERLIGELRHLAELQNLTLVLVTHDPVDAAALCQWACVLDAGRLSEAGVLDELLIEPRSPLLQLFRQRMSSRHRPT